MVAGTRLCITLPPGESDAVAAGEGRCANSDAENGHHVLPSPRLGSTLPKGE